MIHKGREKLGINDDDECRVFDESDGTEIDDDDVLLSYNKGTVFVIGKDWKCEHGVNELAEHVELEVDENGVEAVGDYRDVAGCSDLTKLVKEDVQSNYVGCDDDGNGNDVASNETKNSNKKLSNEVEKESLLSDSTKSDTKDNKIPVKRKMSSELKERGDSVLKKARSITEKLTGEKYRNARLKNLKVYTEEEINAAPSDMEKKRRRFWNEKAEEVTTKKKTAGLDKLTLIGIIDVSWTMRKTSLIEEESRKVLDEEEILKKMLSTQKSNQKKQTIPKNLDRMAAAQAMLEKVNEEMENGKELMKNVSVKKKEELVEEFKKKKVHLDASYTELKRAQDAALKAINGKKKFLNEQMSLKSHAEIEASTLTEDE